MKSVKFYNDRIELTDDNGEEHSIRGDFDVRPKIYSLSIAYGTTLVSLYGPIRVEFAVDYDYKNVLDKGGLH